MKKLVLLGVLLMATFGMAVQAWTSHTPAPILAEEGSRPIGG